MADFYTVLCNALDRVGADDPEERERVYTHVRDVMIRKLRNYRPPLSEDVIETRLETFEAAIDRIEMEIAEAAIAADETAYEEAAVPEGQLHSGNRSDPDRREPQEAAWEEDAAPEPIWGSPAIDMAWDESSEQWRDPSRRRNQDAVEAEWEPDPDYDEARPDELPVVFQDDLDAADPVDDEEPRSRWRRALALRRGGGREPNSPAWSRSAPRRDRQPDNPDSNDDADVEPEPSSRLRRQSAGRGRNGGLWSRLTGAARMPRAAAVNRESPPPRKSIGRRDAVAERETLQTPPDPRRRMAAMEPDVPPSPDPRRFAAMAPEAAPELENSRRPRRGERPVLPTRRSRRRESDDPIDQLASRLGSAGTAARAEPLLIGGPAPEPDEPAEAAEPRLYLPSPQHIEEEEERSRRRPGRKARRSERHADSERPNRQSRRGRARPPPPPPPQYDDEGDSDADFDERAPNNRVRRYIRWALLGFAVIVIGWAAFVFVPILFPSTPDGEVAGETVGETAPEIADDGETIILFRGQDPTVFESGADNPIDFISTDGQGYVRIGSTITSGGARIVIGPGVASRLAGHDVRVVMEVRGAPDQPAATTRLGYQNGVAINEWRILRVPAEFGVVTATWTVPASAGNVADYILIEPGVPGDGNAVDIRAVLIEIVN